MKLKRIILTSFALLIMFPSAAHGFDWGEAYNKTVTTSTYYDPNDCYGTTPVSTGGGTGTYIAIGNIPAGGMQVGTTTYGGNFSGGAWTPHNGQQGSIPPVDDNGMGNDGKPLPGRTAYAELSLAAGSGDYKALGGLPNGTKLEVSYNGKTIIAEKADVGAGGGPINGVPRALDLWWETARLLGFTVGSGVVTIHAVDPSTPVTPINGSATGGTPVTPAATNAAGCCPAGNTLPVSTGIGTPGNDNAVTAYQFFVSHGLAPFRASAIIGNLIQESNVRPAEGNPAASGGGGGIAQWEGGRWSGPNGLLAFANGTGNFKANGVQGKWDDLLVQLNFMWWEATHTHSNALSGLKAATNITDATIAWETAYEGAGIPMMFKRIGYANDTLADPRMGAKASPTGPADTSPTQGGGASGVSGAPGAAATCTTPAGVGNTGGIVGTALGELSWPKPDCSQTAFGATRRNCHDSTPAYAAKGGTHTNPGGTDAFTDCGTFVSTVMRVSGVDTNYPPVQTTRQRTYVRGHPELYKVTPNPGPNDIHPGDILISDDHTMIYVGTQGGDLTRVDASWTDHTPQHGSAGGVIWMLGMSGIVSATYIGPKTIGI